VLRSHTVLAASPGINTVVECREEVKEKSERN